LTKEMRELMRPSTGQRNPDKLKSLSRFAATVSKLGFEAEAGRSKQEVRESRRRVFDPGMLSALNSVANSSQTSSPACIGWLRHSEVKHGRVAMAGALGYLVHEAGIHWPWCLCTKYDGLSAPDVFFADSLESRWPILIVVGFFEFWSEFAQNVEQQGTSHYMRGGKPGKFPTFEGVPLRKFWLPADLFDPFGFTKKLSEKEKADRLNLDINTGRVAMIGLLSFFSEAIQPGAVPLLSGKLKHTAAFELLSNMAMTNMAVPNMAMSNMALAIN